MTVVGARPQFIKLAPLAKALDDHAFFRHILVHTGQHYDSNMSQVFFDTLGIRSPDYQYTISGTTQATQTAEMMVLLEQTCIEELPDAVVVFGDTNSTLAAALVAAKLCIPIVHIEAGLRSFDMRMPEEVNRIITDHVSRYLSCPTDQAKNQLEKEGVHEKATVDGDIMVDTLLHFLPLAEQRQGLLDTWNVLPDTYYVCTLHRNFNVDNEKNLAAIVGALAATRVPIIFSLHPRTKKQLEHFSLYNRLISYSHIHICEPLEYIDMLALMYFSRGIITDSGGIQKEAYLLKKPCITVRSTTEWGETVESGWNTLVCNKNTGMIDETLLTTAIEHPTAHRENWMPYYGDGKTVSRIIALLETI